MATAILIGLLMIAHAICPREPANDYEKRQSAAAAQACIYATIVALICDVVGLFS